jgi:hypothetical protein
MMFGTEISRLGAKPFNIFTCIPELLWPAGMAPTPGPNLALGAGVHRSIQPSSSGRKAPKILKSFWRGFADFRAKTGPHSIEAALA